MTPPIIEDDLLNDEVENIEDLIFNDEEEVNFSFTEIKPTKLTTINEKQTLSENSFEYESMNSTSSIRIKKCSESQIDDEDIVDMETEAYEPNIVNNSIDIGNYRILKEIEDQ